jgi:NADH-quinone oxidoreductase subunit M
MAALFLLITLGVLGMPGLSGFVGEYLIMLGTFTRANWALALAALGVVLAAWYALRLYQGVMNGPPRGEARLNVGLVDLMVLAPVALLTVLIGVYPAPLLSALGYAIAGALGGLAAGT